MPRGKFIALEGGEGSGKDTMVERLKHQYAGREDIIFTREPGGTKGGELIRAVLLDSENRITAESEIRLFLAARLQLVTQVIAPALAQGKTVVSNRFRLSTIAYQIYGRERKGCLPLLKELEGELGLRQYVPLYILLDVLPEVGLKRVENRNDGKTRFDAENLAFHARVREGYLNNVSAPGCVVIDANKPLEDVWTQVRATVAHIL
jgi:dTMP kinase